MTSEQLYDEALKHINGTGGYPKNPKKGEKTMLEASNAGSRKAAGYYAMHYAKNDSDKLIHFQKSGAYEDYPNEYVRCLLTTAQKMAKRNPGIPKSNYDAANRVQAKYHGDGYYYLAELAKLAGDTEQKYKDYLYLAALGMSKAMPDATYALINRDRGVIYDKEEIELWIKANELQDRVAGYGEIKKTEEEAWRIVEAHLSTKEGKEKLPAGGASAMLKKRPTGTLEYQRLINVAMSVKYISVGFEYDNPNYSTVTRGSINDYKLDRYMENWFTDFRCSAKQKDAYKTFEKLSYTKTVPTRGRFRVDTPYYYSLCTECAETSKTEMINEAKWLFKKDLGQQKNWATQHINVTLNKHDTGLKFFRIYFMPFYYFTVDLAFGKTATVRVNAQTGEVDFYENCPFGQFTEYDDYKTGGNVQLNKATVDALKKATAKKDAKKDRTIAKWSGIGALALLVLTIIIGSGTFAGLCFLGAIGLGVFALWKLCKGFFKSLIAKFKK